VSDAAPEPLGWERLAEGDAFRLERRGRFLRAALAGEHLSLSTSVKNGGQRRGLRYLVNHQSCEGKDHRERHEVLSRLGQEGYHDSVCREIGVEPEEAAVMGTAANMNYAAVVAAEDCGVLVTAAVTAGVQGNAACAGDPAAWREVEGKWEKVAPMGGTINTILLINRAVTEAGLARAVVTMTEAKSAALARLAVGSRYSQDLATGTGTDQYSVAAAWVGRPMTSTGPHVKLGELIGRAVRDATLEALRWQNGLEASYTRSLFHALGRYGLKESGFVESMAVALEGRGLELLGLNLQSVCYEPLVSAAAYAVAAVLDRVRYESLPGGVAKEALRQQGACLAVALSARPERWREFREALPEPDLEAPAGFIRAAIGLGWKAKWS